MELKKFMALGIKPREGIEVTKYLPNVTIAVDEDVNQIIELFEKYGYDIHSVPLSFYKIFTKNSKEVKELADVLTAIDEMDFQISEDVSLKSIFQNDLRYGCFTPSFIARLKFCLANNINFAFEDNTFIGPLFDADIFAAYTVQIPAKELKKAGELGESDYAPFAQNTESLNNMNKPEPMSLVDEEDLSVRNEIIHNLTLAQMNNQDDKVFDQVLAKILSNLNDVIALDNKQYRILGTRHLVENALAGMELTPEEQFTLDFKILTNFPDNNEVKEEGVRR